MVTAKFRVVRKYRGPDNPQTGVVSNHKTLEAAQKAIDKANASLRRLPGQENSWHPYEAQVLIDGTWERANAR